MFREIKFGFQRMFRGYSDDIKWDFECYFQKFIKPLKEFCIEEIKDAGKFNSKRTEIYEQTLKLIKDYEEMKFEEQMLEDNAGKKLWKYIGEHIGYYWS